MALDVAYGQPIRLRQGEIHFASSENGVEDSLARIFAPILWFSRDESLRLAGTRVPEVLPCDFDAARDQVGAPVVYYFISLNVDEPLNQRLSTRTLDIQYLFYYREARRMAASSTPIV